jgi:N-acyl-D-aspartate/D-glutamate deacylase
MTFRSIRAQRSGLVLATAVAAALTACQEPAPAGPYDLVIAGGRVLDPETGLDEVRNVGIRGGRIEAVTTDGLEGVDTIAATGLVVVPGFIDLHVHRQNDETFGLMARDGVTSVFELEVGTADVEGWYAGLEGGQIVNYGVSIGHIPVRMAVMGDEGTFLPSGPGGSAPASEEQVAEIARRIEEGLDQGAVAVGFGLAYTPAATTTEFRAMLDVAAAHGASSHIHVRGGLEGLIEALETAADAGAPLHVVHANSSGGAYTADFVTMIHEAQQAGQGVTTEAYPYGAGMTAIESALFDDWQEWDDEQFGIHQWVETGERLTRESFGRYREQGGAVIIHGRTEEMTRAAIGSPLTMIASDGGVMDGRGHPRTSGTNAKVLGQYVRDEGLVELPDAIRRMTIEPARRLQARVPQMARKGRIQVGADADITVFDPEAVTDRATYTDPTAPSQGIPHVVLNGVRVVRDGELVSGARPGRAIRAPTGG